MHCYQSNSAEPTRIPSGESSLSGFRGPVDVALTRNGRYLLSINQLSDSVSLIDVASRNVVSEYQLSKRPTSLTLIDDQSALISCSTAGVIELIHFDQAGIRAQQKYHVGFEPVGLAVDVARGRAFVGLAAASAVAELDLTSGTIARRIEVGSWPRYVTLSLDGTRLAVGCSGDSKVYVIDATKGEVLYDEPLSGAINMGHMQVSRDGKYAYLPWMIYRTNPINVRNIQLGWVLASRIARVRLDGPSYREAISLDVPRLAIADPHGLAITPNEHRLAVTASGTHELLVYRLQDLPFEGAGGPGDLIDRRLLADRDMFYRIELGGRPMGLALADDNRTAYIANYLQDAIQVVDIETKEVGPPILLGKIPPRTVAHRGMEIFYDGRRSLDQWYSCHTCHYNGGINSKAMDTENDGSINTFKTVLPLEKLQQTKPWTWHGWQEDIDNAMVRSFTKTMQGPDISPEDVRTLLTYLDTLEIPPSPHRLPDGGLTPAAARGQQVFQSEKAGCARCHSGPLFTDGQVHDVGLGGEKDRYKGYNTPMLVGLYRKVRFLHDGRTKSLEQLLTDHHAPENVTGAGALTEAERADLIEYLKSL
ncbi:MAG: c-type cytochrome [Pirellulaceae bacterium]|nr:c-type cytochrome [Pirellulaceae bacterium]